MRMVVSKLGRGESPADPAGYANVGFCYELLNLPAAAEAAYKQANAQALQVPELSPYRDGNEAHFHQ